MEDIIRMSSKNDEIKLVKDSRVRIGFKLKVSKKFHDKEEFLENSILGFVFKKCYGLKFFVQIKFLLINITYN